MEFSQTTNSSGVNIISADSSVVSTLEDDDQEIVSNTKPATSSSSSTTVTGATSSSGKKKDDSSPVIKRESGANRSPFPNQKPTERDNFTSINPVAQPTKAGLYGRTTHPQLKTSKFSAAAPPSDYLAGHYLSRQQMEFAKGEPMYNDLQKVMMRPQQHMHFNQHHKVEGGYIKV